MLQPPSPPNKDYKELRMIIRSLFMYEISRNWFIRLLPVLAGYWFYEWTKETILLIAWGIYSFIEIIKALNYLIFHSNITLIQANDLITNFKKLLGKLEGELIARHPESDFSGAKTNTNASITQKRLLAGTFLQERLNEKLGEGKTEDVKKTDNSPLWPTPETPETLYWLRFDATKQQHIYQVDGGEFPAKSIIDMASQYEGKKATSPTAHNVAKAKYWSFTAAFVKNDKLERAGRVKLVVTNPEDTAEGKKQ